MTTETTSVSIAREPELVGQTVVVIGGSAGIGVGNRRASPRLLLAYIARRVVRVRRARVRNAT